MTTTHKRLAAWVDEVARLTTPDQVPWVPGYEQEWTQLTRKLVDAGPFVRLHAELRTTSC